jgi:autotransporter-associated beta strand protein
VISRRRFALATGTLSLGIVGATASMTLGQQLAFPEAEGFGRFATGARGNLASSTVYHVTNLNDSGAGSFRDAVSQPNRFIVFDVGGIARINSVITFASNLTIAGQTAPGGFQVYGNRVAFHGANNLVSRYWGARNAATNDNDAASLARGTDMIFDHMSITWGRDGTFDINPDSGQIIDNLTIQNTVIAQGLQASNHSTGGLMTLSENRNFSIIKSLFADNKTRNPKARGNNEFINNVLYGWTEDGYIMGDTVNAIGRANAEGNYFIRGPLSSSHPFSNGTAQFQIYGNGNLYDSNQNGVADGSPVTSYPGATVMPTRHNFPTTSVMSAPDALAFVLDNVGPSITRDVVDTSLVNEVKSYGTLGGLIVRETDVYPNYDTDPQYVKPRARLTDTDGDGMPDNWETSKGLNPISSGDFKNLNGGGYARIEEYVNELGGYGTSKTAAAGGAWTTAATWGGAVPNFTTSATATGGITHASGNGFARQATLDGTSTVSGGTLDIFDTVLVGGGATGSMTITGGTVSAGRVLLAAPGRTGSLTLNGGTLQTGPIVSGGGAATLTLNGGTIRFTGAPNVAVPTVVAAGGATLNTNGFSGSITGGLSGSGTLTKTGAGTLTLGGNNAAYSGGINLNAGAITLATSGANSSTGAITAAHGTTLNVLTSGASTPLALSTGATVTLSAGGLTYNGAITGAAGTTLLVSTSSSGASNFSIGGNLAAFAGTLDLGTSTGNIRIGGSGSSLANFDVGDSTGTIRTSNDGTTNFGSLTGGVNTKLQGSTNGSVASTYVIGANGNTTTFAGTLSDGTNVTPAIVNITKTGLGTLTLTNVASTYTGATTVSAGALNVPALANGGAASPIGDSSNAAVNLVLDGGTFRYTGAAVATDRAFTVGAAGGTLDASGSGAVDFNGVGAVVASGIGDRTLTLRGNNTGANYLRLDLADPAAGGKLSLTKDGSGTWRFAGNAKTYSGNTTVNAGTLQLPVAGVLPTGAGKGNVVVAAGATLDLCGNSHTINGLSGAGTVTTTQNTTRTLTLGNGDANATFAGVLTQGAGQTLALTKSGAGTQTLSGTNLHAGVTTVAAGKLVAASGRAFGAGPLSVQNGAVAQAQAGLPVALTLASVATAGTGQLDLTNNDAVIRSMTPAQVQPLIAQGFAVGSWNGPGINSSLAAGGSLNAIGFAGNDVLGKTSFKGVSPLTTSDVLVKYTYFGDADLSGTVTLDDFTLFLNGYQSAGVTWVQGDFDYNGVVTLDDFALFLAGYQQQGAPLGAVESMIESMPMTPAERAAMRAAVAAVPEPAAATAGVAALLIVSQRRRRRHAGSPR